MKNAGSERRRKKVKVYFIGAQTFVRLPQLDIHSKFVDNYKRFY